MQITLFLKLEITNHFKETFVGDNWKINCQKRYSDLLNRMPSLSVRI